MVNVSARYEHRGGGTRGLRGLVSAFSFHCLLAYSTYSNNDTVSTNGSKRCRVTHSTRHSVTR